MLRRAVATAARRTRMVPLSTQIQCAMTTSLSDHTLPNPEDMKEPKNAPYDPSGFDKDDLGHRQFTRPRRPHDPTRTPFKFIDDQKTNKIQPLPDPYLEFQDFNEVPSVESMQPFEIPSGTDVLLMNKESIINNKAAAEAKVKDVDVKVKRFLDYFLQYAYFPPSEKEKINPSRPRMRLIDEYGRAWGKGSRKTAVATAFIKPGTGKIIVNGMSYTEYFPDFDDRRFLLEVFYLTGTLGQFDVFAQVHGSGKVSQGGAIMMAIARAMQEYDPYFRQQIRHLLTRDMRMVERKKVGKAGARKGYTWVKR